MKNYELYFKDIHIGSLKETNWDMRSAGDIVYHFDFSEEASENSSLAALIRLSIKSSTYWDEVGEDETYFEMCKQQEQFLDIIESPDWYIVDDKVKKVQILCPIFHNNNTIVWQEDYINKNKISLIL
ncbi:hypothetical protein [Flavobacterium hungaricum]|uniref:Immunity protein 22 n=1 Tax=Flavobacterium hungaricum TaxID=2082725 RepID=A0ABR9TEB6_9FLAO|nr:hypothetical protein [Flavobacterium hungaricum]MBE8723680.1 hypothetical protein [Flavobacterium hungaricum]